MTGPADSLSLTAGFPAATREQWRTLVDAVLKGAPHERLASRTHDGLVIAPLYGRATAPPISGRPAGTAWTVMQRVDHPDPAAANAQALEDLNNGATGLLLVFAGAASANGFGLDPSSAALERVLDDVHLDAGIAIELDLSAQSRQMARELADLIRRRGLAPSKVHLRPGFNAIGAFAMSGRAPGPWNDTAPHLAGVIGKVAAAGFPGPFVVADGRVIHNAGGSEAQELAFVLASAVAYLRALEASGMALEAARDAIYFRLTADADQLLTMAKFRAARTLWARVAVACGLAPKPVLITAETAWRTMTRRDPYVNVLRAAVAVTAAALGGADSIVVLPHTAALGLPDALARRIARNIQLVLLEESNLARVADPAAGSGTFEALTQELAAKAWQLFQQIESAGGIWAALESGAIAQSVAAVHAERQQAVARRTDVLTGTNQFADIHEPAAAVLNVAPADLAEEETAGAVAVRLLRIRLAEPFERLRDASDRHLAATGARPKVFLATLGRQADFSARATFAKNLFEAGGIEAVSRAGDSTALGDAFRTSGAMLACLCASDTVYESEAASAAAALKAAGACHIYLAGRPGAREATLRAVGVQSFIYEGCDALATLQTAYDILGITQRARP